MIDHVDLNLLKGVIVKVPVGKKPPSIITKVLLDTKAMLREMFPEYTKVMVVACKDQKDYSFIFLEK